MANHDLENAVLDIDGELILHSKDDLEVRRFGQKVARGSWQVVLEAVRHYAEVRANGGVETAMYQSNYNPEETK